MGKLQNKPIDIDKECVDLCHAMNKMPGIDTIQSCCGHGLHPFCIWFKAKDLASLPRLIHWFDKCHSGIDGWKVYVTTDCAMSPVTFCVKSTNVGQKAYDEASMIAGLLSKDAGQRG